MRGRESLSVAVITYNEEQNLERCLRSVSWAQEIVVVDSGSTDRTLEIAASHGATVFSRPWPGYVAQKNWAIGRTRHRWVLSLDADEWLSDEGAAEVREVLEAPRAGAYAFNRRTAFCGAFLRHTWSPDWQTRLFLKEHATFVGGRVHESVRLAPGIRARRLRCRLPHLAYRSIHDYVERMNRYTDLAAETLVERGTAVPWLRMLLSPPATFVKLFILRRGFLDGVRGLVVSAGSAYYVLLKYSKLWERSRRPDDEGSGRRNHDDRDESAE